MINSLRQFLYCLLIIILCLGLPSSVYADKQKRFTTHSINHNGMQRTYHLHIPQKSLENKKKPLIIVLHGGGGRGIALARAKDASNFIDQSDKNDFIVVFPEGHRRQWNDGRKKIYKRGQKVMNPADDVGFIAVIIEQLSKEYSIDRNRVFATGISNGGFMSFRLALDLTDKIRAIAPVTAQLSKAIGDKKPSQPISVMIFNGTEDPLVPYGGGEIKLFKRGRSRGEIHSTDETIRRFVKHNNCRSRPQKQVLEDYDRYDQTRVSIETYDSCQQQTKVVLVRIQGGGHTWPGGIQYLPERRVGRVSRDINATEMIVDFFLSH